MDAHNITILDCHFLHLIIASFLFLFQQKYEFVPTKLAIYYMVLGL